MLKWLFLQSKPLIRLATGYTGCDTNIERDLNLSALIYESNESKAAQTEDVRVGIAALAQGTQMPFASSSSRSQ